MTEVIKVEAAININPAHLLFEFLVSLIIKKNNEQSKLLFPVFSVNDNNDVVSLISIAILFLAIAFSQIN